MVKLPKSVWIKVITPCMAASIICVSACAAEVRDLFADTWDAMDDLGRCVASAGLPAPRAKKVGIFYWTWHQGRKGPVLDNSKLLAEDPTLPQRPRDPKWGLRKTHYWGEPAFGYYATTDAWVLRRHAQLLSAAGVDVVVFDNTEHGIAEAEALEIAESAVRNVIYWSDDRLCHWMFDRKAAGHWYEGLFHNNGLPDEIWDFDPLHVNVYE